MVRRKTKKQRGGHYGRGMKAGRGKGKRGGRGMAGLHKHKWVWTIKNDPLHFGGKGFTSHHPKEPVVPITLHELADQFEQFKERGFVETVDNETVINLRNAGYTKLLATGEFRTKSRIIIDNATEKSINKLSSFGTTVETDGRDTEE